MYSIIFNSSPVLRDCAGILQVMCRGQITICIEKPQQWGSNKLQYWRRLLRRSFHRESSKPLSNAAVFLKSWLFPEKSRDALFQQYFQLSHSITPTHLTFLSPDKYWCYTVAAVHSDMKCAILAESICLADIHKTMTPTHSFFALDLMSDA